MIRRRPTYAGRLPPEDGIGPLPWWYWTISWDAAERATRWARVRRPSPESRARAAAAAALLSAGAVYFPSAGGHP